MYYCKYCGLELWYMEEIISGICDYCYWDDEDDYFWYN